MRPFLIFAAVMAVAMVVAAMPARAADSHGGKKDALPDFLPPPVERQPLPAPEPAPVPEARPPAGQQTQMRTPQQPTVEDLSKAQYESCMTRQNGALSGDIIKEDTLRQFCECTAENFKNTMSVEDLRTMAAPAGTPAAQAQYRRYQVHVYAPCMSYAVRDLLAGKCGDNKEVASQHPQSGAAICGCMAESMEKYVAERGQAMLAQHLLAKPEEQNPFGWLLSNQIFRVETEKAYMACAGKHGNP